MRNAVMRRAVLTALLSLAAASTARATDLTVGPGARFATITAALAAAQPGDRVLVRAGTYREATLVVRTPRLTVQGDGWPVLDGQGAREVLVIAADDVTVRGLVLTNTGVSSLEDRAGIRARDARNCVIERNRLRDNLWGIYLQRATDCIVRDNDIVAHGAKQTESGNGIHLWYSSGARVERNHIRGHRDGIYFEFSTLGVTRDNVSEQSQRYGMHFMFSDSCRYERNIFRDNNSGVAVMYSRSRRTALPATRLTSPPTPPARTRPSTATGGTSTRATT
ncbi:MAG: right-handed parallel beta-helix repeat-containing protein [Gemmatimonadetes bacterium]|nr:right-handed parallel beta-helix repeat-containing protein [Gemmatimonadota bacterium]